MRNYYLYPFFIAFVFIFTGCFEQESFPPEPIVKYKNFVLLGDSARLSFEFTDGDGDIGLEKDNFEPPFDSSSYYQYNIYVEYYEKTPNGWERGINPLGDSIVFGFRIEPILDGNRPKPLKGSIDVNMQDWYNPISSYNDTIKFRFQLIDRALNESNWGETPAIIRAEIQ